MREREGRVSTRIRHAGAEPNRLADQGSGETRLGTITTGTHRHHLLTLDSGLDRLARTTRSSHESAAPCASALRSRVPLNGDDVAGITSPGLASRPMPGREQDSAVSGFLAHRDPKPSA
ncbi:hypothetical protein GCM10009668_01890 [Nocardioides dubius]|uniref:Uncharacterized protein n=1 Tax=Nocardioides dubius TaxID=317019 RepID=A0ABN1TJP7_9ACTN